MENRDLARALTGLSGAVIGAAMDIVQEMPGFPDRELPSDENGVFIPDTDYPHTQLGQRKGRKETYPQAREFGENGEPIRDIDFTDHCRPQNHPLPHQHLRDENETGGTKKRNEKGTRLPEWNYEQN